MDIQADNGAEFQREKHIVGSSPEVALPQEELKTGIRLRQECSYVKTKEGEGTDDDSEEESGSISSSTSYSTDMHSSGDDTDSKVDLSPLDTDEDSSIKLTGEVERPLHKAVDGSDTETGQRPLHKAVDGSDTKTGQPKTINNRLINWEKSDGGGLSELNGHPPVWARREPRQNGEPQLVAEERRRNLRARSEKENPHTSVIHTNKDRAALRDSPVEPFSAVSPGSRWRLPSYQEKREGVAETLHVTEKARRN